MTSEKFEESRKVYRKTIKLWLDDIEQIVNKKKPLYMQHKEYQKLDIGDVVGIYKEVMHEPMVEFFEVHRWPSASTSSETVIQVPALFLGFSEGKNERQVAKFIYLIPGSSHPGGIKEIDRISNALFTRLLLRNNLRK